MPLELLFGITVFVLAVFLGFELISKVPPTLHTPLMSGSNAISGITLVGALVAAGAVSGVSVTGVLGAGGDVLGRNLRVLCGCPHQEDPLGDLPGYLQHPGKHRGDVDGKLHPVRLEPELEVLYVVDLSFVRNLTVP